MGNKALGGQAHYGPKWLGPAGLVVAIILFFVGMWSVPLAIFGPDRALIPGDLGDARFNNYILEHFHRYITGRTAAYWDAPFMYPWKNVIALSDNLLGTAPFYSAFRILGFSREGAFQAWILSLFALNYLCCLVAFRNWGRNWVLAACSAYIFAFGIYNIGQMNNLQMLPKFMVPLAFLFFWKHLSTGSWKYLLLAVLATVYQFYCGVYLGFMLAYALFFLSIGHAVIYRAPSYIGRFREWRFTAGWLGCVVLGLLILMPMMLPYMQVAKDLGTRNFLEVVDSIPRPSSYFFTHPAALSWRALNEVGKNAFPLWWSHFLFIGAVPWATVLFAPAFLLLKRIPSGARRLVAAVSISLVLSTLFCLNVDGHTLYALVFKLPGFSALRAIDRFINVQVLFFLLVFVAVLRPFFRKPGAALALSLLVPLLVVQDNRWDVGWTKRFDKHESQKLVQDVERRMTREYGGSENWDAIAYEPLRPVRDDHESWHLETITIQLNTMLAGQQLGIPVVNGYPGSYPGNYISFFDNMDHRTLADWCRFNGMGPGRIQEVHGVGIPIAVIDTVVIQASNGRYVSCDGSKDDLIIADRAVAAIWENFLRVRTVDGRFAFMAFNGNFLCAEERDGGRWAATGLDLGDFGLFTVEVQADGSEAIKAHNGFFLSLNKDSGQLFASGGSPGPDERLRVIPVHGTPP